MEILGYRILPFCKPSVVVDGGKRGYPGKTMKGKIRQGYFSFCLHGSFRDFRRIPFGKKRSDRSKEEILNLAVQCQREWIECSRAGVVKPTVFLFKKERTGYLPDFPFLIREMCGKACKVCKMQFQGITEGLVFNVDGGVNEIQ